MNHTKLLFLAPELPTLAPARSDSLIGTCSRYTLHSTYPPSYRGGDSGGGGGLPGGGGGGLPGGGGGGSSAGGGGSELESESESLPYPASSPPPAPALLVLSFGSSFVAIADVTLRPSVSARIRSQAFEKGPPGRRKANRASVFPCRAVMRASSCAGFADPASDLAVCSISFRTSGGG